MMVVVGTPRWRPLINIIDIKMTCANMLHMDTSIVSLQTQRNNDDHKPNLQINLVHNPTTSHQLSVGLNR